MTEGHYLAVVLWDCEDMEMEYYCQTLRQSVLIPLIFKRAVEPSGLGLRVSYFVLQVQHIPVTQKQKGG